LDNAVHGDEDDADVRGPEVSIRHQVLTGHAGLTRSVWRKVGDRVILRPKTNRA
jgi:hypothetical protein